MLHTYIILRLVSDQWDNSDWGWHHVEVQHVHCVVWATCNTEQSTTVLVTPKALVFFTGVPPIPIMCCTPQNSNWAYLTHTWEGGCLGTCHRINEWIIASFHLQNEWVIASFHSFQLEGGGQCNRLQSTSLPPISGRECRVSSTHTRFIKYVTCDM